MRVIELRSDTFTQPTPAMRAAMAAAAVGNDDYGEDPTVARLERMSADLLGMGAACLMPSGTMANLAAILSHAPRGSKVIVGRESDIYLYEAAGASVCGAVAYEPVANRPDGTLDPVELAMAFPEDPDDAQFAPAGLLCLENTQNRCGGVPLTETYQRQVAGTARERGVPVHLDGARIFNAALATGTSVARLAAPVDSVQFCLSKGLGAPIGSVLAGPTRFVATARRVRKMLGGGMRQAGVVAAAGILALTEMVDRLDEDHGNARRLADSIAHLPGLSLSQPVSTNIVLFRVDDERFTTLSFVETAGRAGVRLLTFGHGRIRAVTHCDVRTADIDEAVARLERVLRAGPVRSAAAPVSSGSADGQA
jgi:threonine aldolase